MRRSTYYCLMLVICALATRRASATVVCSVSSLGTAFGAYDTLSGSNKDVIGTISVTCTGLVGDAVNYSIALSPGGGTFTSRKMLAGGSQLKYNLYSDGARLSIWGDGTGGTSTVSDSYSLPASSSTRNYTVYGEIPAQTNPTNGSYMDTVVITVTY
jgi:spore coat protein U-like protein